jgi:hypothetical protein
MSHLIKEYSKNLEVKPLKPFVNKHFYPVVPEKYIVIYNEQEVQSKNYRYYTLVIDLIKNALSTSNVSVVMIGSNNNISNNIDYEYTNLSFRNNCYIVSKSLLLISIDNAISQYASSESVMTVNLYGNMYSSITTPYWSPKDKKIDIEPKWNIKPCFNVLDKEDSINKIPAEEVSNSILKSLRKKLKSEKVLNQKVNFKTITVNKNKEYSIDVIPTTYVDLKNFKNKTINLRLNCNVDGASVQKYLSNHKCRLILEDSLINIDAIKGFKNNIEGIQLILNKKINKIPKEYFHSLKSLGINFSFLVKNKEILDDTRFEYFDEVVEFHKPNNKKPKNVKPNNYFFSFKMVVEGNKIYKSTYHWENKLDNSDNIVDNPNYWEELDYFYIYEQDRNQNKNR